MSEYEPNVVNAIMPPSAPPTLDPILRERDKLWCIALLNNLDTREIENVLRNFNALRMDESPLTRAEIEAARPSIVEAFAELREKFGHHFNGIDPITYVRELRGDDGCSESCDRPCLVHATLTEIQQDLRRQCIDVLTEVRDWFQEAFVVVYDPEDEDEGARNLTADIVALLGRLVPQA